jgi:hypothetical protein
MAISPEQFEALLTKHEQTINELRQEVAQLNGKLAALTSPVLHATENFGDSAEQPPLDSPVIWMRGQKQSTPPEYSVEILSLIQEVVAERSYPWPLYIQLTSSHNEGHAVGAYVRLIEKGNGWGTSFHTDVIHEGTGTTIGSNIEVTKKTTDGRAIGVNIQSKGHWTEEGINLQSDSTSGWKTGIHFDDGSKGTRGIWMQGKWDVGIDMGDNAIRMNQGAELCFDETRRFYVKYNPDTNRIEFHNRGDGEDKVIGYIPADADEHKL